MYHASNASIENTTGQMPGCESHSLMSYEKVFYVFSSIAISVRVTGPARI